MVKAVADHTGAIHNEAGLDTFALSDWVFDHGGVAGFPGGDAITDQEFWAAEVDICVPAALENQVGAREAHALTVRLVAEGANGPCNPEGEAVLRDRNIDVLPDVLANAGGVTVSYYEWVQNRRSEQWPGSEVELKLTGAMRKGAQLMYDTAARHGCSLRVACYAAALDRLESVYEQRGIFP